MPTSKDMKGPGNKPAGSVSASKIHEVLTRINPQQLALAYGTGGSVNPAETRALLRSAGVAEEEINANLDTYRTSIEDYARQTIQPEEARKVQMFAQMLEDSEKEMASLVGLGKILDATAVSTDIAGQPALEAQVTPGMEEEEEEGRSES